MHTISNSSTALVNSTPHSNKKAWLVCLIASLFFLYEFTQMNFINSISPNLIKSLQLSSGQLGMLASAYLISNVIFLLPAGNILDRFAVNKVILSTLGLCILGTYLRYHPSRKAKRCNRSVGRSDSTKTS